MSAGTFLALVLGIYSISGKPLSITPDGSYITGANLEAQIEEDKNKVVVDIEYKIKKEPGTRTISYEGLETFNTRFERVEAKFGSTFIDLGLSRDSIKVGGIIEFPEKQIADSTLSLILRYTIANANLQKKSTFNINIPILWIVDARGGTNAELFKAHLTLPDQYYVSESFPVAHSKCHFTDGLHHTCLSLQVLPTFLRVRGMVGYNPVFTPLRALDYSLVFLLVSTCATIILLLVRKKHLLPA